MARTEENLAPVNRDRVALATIADLTTFTENPAVILGLIRAVCHDHGIIVPMDQSTEVTRVEVAAGPGILARVPPPRGQGRPSPPPISC